jgi:hypothetical protein
MTFIGTDDYGQSIFAFDHETVDELEKALNLAAANSPYILDSKKITDLYNTLMRLSGHSGEMG